MAKSSRPPLLPVNKHESTKPLLLGHESALLNGVLWCRSQRLGQRTNDLVQWLLVVSVAVSFLGYLAQRLIPAERMWIELPPGNLHITTMMLVFAGVAHRCLGPKSSTTAFATFASLIFFLGAAVSLFLIQPHDLCHRSNPNVTFALALLAIGLFYWVGRTGRAWVVLSFVGTGILFALVSKAPPSQPCVVRADTRMQTLTAAATVFCVLVAGTLGIYHLAEHLATGSKRQRTFSVGAAGIGIILIAKWIGVAVRDVFQIDLEDTFFLLGLGLLPSLFVEGWSQDTTKSAPPVNIEVDQAKRVDPSPEVALPMTLPVAIRATVAIWELWAEQRRLRRHAINESV